VKQNTRRVLGKGEGGAQRWREAEHL